VSPGPGRPHGSAGSRRRLLQPVRSRRRLPLTLATLLAPALGLLALVGVDSIRGPLAEREAALAVAIRPPDGADASLAGLPRPEPTSIALAGLGPRLFGGSELSLRAAGLAAGAISLGAAVRLGQRLFATRVGVLSAVFLLATPAGRGALGTRLGADPFYLFALLVCLSATRNLARSRRSLAHAGAAAGAALALVGPAALWLPIATGAWLRRLHGLDRRSLARLLVWTAAPAVGATALAALAVGADAPAHLAEMLVRPAPAPGPSLAEIGWSLPALLPLAALGVWHLPQRWTRSESLRFLFWWAVLSAANAALTGSTLGATLALLFFAAALAAWALDRAPRRHALVAFALAAIASSWAPGAARPARSHRLEAWAARETGRYLRHVVPRGRDVAAVPTAAGRLTFYGHRPVARLGPSNPDLRSIDYVVLDAAALERLGAAVEEHGHRVRTEHASLRILAEFGPWIVARVEGASEASAPAPPGRASGPAGPAEST